MTRRRVAVTGAGGRLGRALVDALAAADDSPLAWQRPELDLDEPASLAALVERDRPDAVIHAAAWTDVDGCAREPDVAMRRNGDATGALARGCAARSVRLVHISTNEVFEGRPARRREYGHRDATVPVNAYGASKLMGERRALEAFRGPSRTLLAIVRTAWLFGPPGGDFPDKILDAADRARASHSPLLLVADEVGNPTFAPDLAVAIVALLDARAAGIHHVTNRGSVSRAGWARALLAAAGLEVMTEDVPSSTWPRPSTPPLRAVLRPTALPGDVEMRSWEAATAAYLPDLLAIRAGRPAAALR